MFGEKISIRVANIDTPEIKTKNKCEKELAQKSKLFVENILKKSKRIDLVNVTRGKYFRIVADVVVNGISLTKLLLNNNFGYTYTGGTKKKVNWCNFQQRLPAKEDK